jgi:hypothetical protein
MMNNRLWQWGLPLLCGLLLSFSADARRIGGVGVEIVSDHGRALPEYRVEGRPGADTYKAYIEATEGSRYGIRVTNDSDRKVGLVIAVDGRNIISGQRSELGNDERMYILEPRSSATYDGWRTARDRVHRFYFTQSGDSYAGAFGDDSAMGVIAVAVYPERVRRPALTEGDRNGRGAAPGSAAAAAAPAERSEPGTGYGEGKYDPSVVVHFESRETPSQRVFLKYEWRETLCAKGVIDPCRPRKGGNRFWQEDDQSGYAPPPPRSTDAGPFRSMD